MSIFGVFIHLAVIYGATAFGVLLGIILGALLRMAADAGWQQEPASGLSEEGERVVLNWLRARKRRPGGP